VVIDDGVVEAIEALGPLAPLHNPVNAAGIREARRVLGGVPHVAVFDTAFHQTLPARAFLYGLPYEYYAEKGVRRYGFHGTSHAYVCRRAARYLGRRAGELKIVSCHLGNGSSVCAVDRGRSVDTSMGFTPGEGLIMGTRCGDVDAGVCGFLQREEGLTAGEVEGVLNQRGGILGLSGISGDLREVERAADLGDQRAALAIEAFCYRLKKYIAAYVGVLGGMDVLVFTGGIGLWRPRVRSLALRGLGCLGVQLDEGRNSAVQGGEKVERISSEDSAVAVLVVPTDEEWMIGVETLRALGWEAEAQRLERAEVEQGD
jgi:acetate kinase